MSLITSTARYRPGRSLRPAMRPLYPIVFQCRPSGGELKGHPLETLDVGWFSRDALPQPLAGYDFWGEQAFAAIDGHPLEVRFDPPREPVWKGDATP